MNQDQAYRFSPYTGQPLTPIGKGHYKDPSNNQDIYLNPAPTAAAIIADAAGQVMLVQRKREPGKDMWDLPGGFVDLGETLEQAIKRELKEELGVEISSLTYLGSATNNYEYQGINYPIVDTAWVVTLADALNEFEVGDDVAAFKWVAYHNVNYDEIWTSSIKKLLKAYFEHQQQSTT